MSRYSGSFRTPMVQFIWNFRIGPFSSPPQHSMQWLLCLMYEGDSDIELHAVKGNRVIETRRVNYRITSLLYKSRLESNACVCFSMVNSNRLRCIFEWILGDRFVMQYHYFAEPAGSLTGLESLKTNSHHLKLCKLVVGFYRINL